MKCKKCGRNNVPLYRNAPKGELANWSCIHCVDPEFMPNGEVRKICGVISRNQPTIPCEEGD
jgi:hypothetical protein